MTSFPRDFVWGAATAAHQVEGNNINSDLWVLEHCKPTLFEEPSLDACDHYHRFRDDIRLLASLGLNCYRFSVGMGAHRTGRWALLDFGTRSLPARNWPAANENKITPMVSSTISVRLAGSPRGRLGKRDAGDLFVRYCERSAKHLGDLISLASTFNEPKSAQLCAGCRSGDPFTTVMRMSRQATKALGGNKFGCFFLGDADKLQHHMIAAHHRALAALKSGPGSYPVGVNVSLQDEQAWVGQQA